VGTRATSLGVSSEYPLGGEQEERVAIFLFVKRRPVRPAATPSGDVVAVVLDPGLGDVPAMDHGRFDTLHGPPHRLLGRQSAWWRLAGRSLGEGRAMDDPTIPQLSTDLYAPRAPLLQGRRGWGTMGREGERRSVTEVTGSSCCA
jgi:hypothetical protein